MQKRKRILLLLSLFFLAVSIAVPVISELAEDSAEEAAAPENMFIKEVSYKNLGRTDPFAEDDIELPF